jgi:hypothetical protein
LALTVAAAAVNVPLLWVAAILTVPGTVMLALLLESPTVTPPEGAGPDNVTVQAEVPGAVTVPGEQLRVLGTTAVGLTGSVIELGLPIAGIEAPPAVEATAMVI